MLCCSVCLLCVSTRQRRSAAFLKQIYKIRFNIKKKKNQYKNQILHVQFTRIYTHIIYDIIKRQYTPNFQM